MEDKIKRLKTKYMSGVNGKILRMTLIISIVMIVIATAITITLLHALNKTLEDIVKNEGEVIEKNSKEAVINTTKEGFMNIITWSADQIDDEFWIMCHDYAVLGEQVKNVLENPSDYKIRPLEEPRIENDGEYKLQLLTPEGVSKNDYEIQSKLGRIANLEPMMAEIVRGNNDYTMDCYVALPNGVALAMDNMSAGKYQEDGSIRHYDATTRAWFQGAVAKQGIYFSEDIDSHFYGIKEITWGLPIYVDGQLAVVLNGASKMEALKHKLATRNVGKTGFTVLLSDKGHVVVTQRENGELAQDADNTTDVRINSNPSLAEAATKAVNQETGFSEVSVDGEQYYVAYAPVNTIGWTLMMFVSVKELEDPAVNLQKTMNAVSNETIDSFDKHVKVNSAGLIIGLVIITLITVHLISRKTLKNLRPIQTMTKVIQNMNRDNMVFKMQDEYRTNDEIEVLAEAFADMSDRLQDYLKEIIEKTAKEERINTEINTASTIQLAMLPGMTEEISSRKEFDIYADMVPAKHVGGDLYDYFLIDDNHLAFVVGDVSGKGISAALFMVLAKTTIQNQLLAYGTDVVKAVTEANRLLVRDNAAELFVTVWVGVLTLDSGELRFVDAGHELAAVSKNGEDFTVKKDNHSIVLGMSDRVKFKLNEVKLEDGDTIYLYTDGVVEALNADDKMFRVERLISTLNEDTSRSPKELDEAVRNAVDSFVDGVEQFDDITSLVIRYYNKDN